MNKQRALRHLNDKFEQKLIREMLSGICIGFGIAIVGVTAVVYNADAIDSAANDFFSWIVLKITI